VASNTITAIKAPKSITTLDLRIRRMDGNAYPFSSRLNGVPLAASTNRISFTHRFYQIVKARNSSKKPAIKNKFINIHDNAKKMQRPSTGSSVSHPGPYATLSHALYCIAKEKSPDLSIRVSFEGTG
jgi:hypothetical protein